MKRGSATAVSLPSLAGARDAGHSSRPQQQAEAKSAPGQALQKSSSVATPLPALAAQQDGVLAVRGKSREEVSGSMYGRHWTSVQKRLLHEERERTWLRRQAKHRFIDFSDSERKELRRYFDALAENQDKVKLDKLEDMLISLGLAADRQEVLNIVKAVHGGIQTESRELDFEEFLEIVRTRADFAIFRVFKAMMEGRLGDRNLNFQTVISTYRRQLILDGTGAGNAQGDCQERGANILQNFAALQKSRMQEGEEQPRPRSNAANKHMTFDTSGSNAPLGGLVMMWRGVCHEQHLVASRPASSEKKTRHTLDVPPSPREVIDNIISSGKNGMGQFSRQRGTVLVMSDDLHKSLAGRDPDADRLMHSPAFSMRILDE
mmetsp:Transcript_43216/g.99625  ORF Transcript_43216/g.99625 Transcript_43216/m.99625 type:complete len:376 (-) Transcript_43216:19-1146(-)